jgi:hypothetical protein
VTPRQLGADFKRQFWKADFNPPVPLSVVLEIRMQLFRFAYGQVPLEDVPLDGMGPLRAVQRR